jgi:hypothetical protein
MAQFEVTKGPKGWPTSVMIEVEDADRPVTFHIPGCECARGWKVIGLPAELQGEGTNYVQSLRENKTLIVCGCIGRYVG